MFHGLRWNLFIVMNFKEPYQTKLNKNGRAAWQSAPNTHLRLQRMLVRIPEVTLLCWRMAKKSKILSYVHSRKNRESAKNEKSTNFYWGVTNLVKSTLRVPVARSGWKTVHCSCLFFGYIVAPRNLSICESQKRHINC